MNTQKWFMVVLVFFWSSTIIAQSETSYYINPKTGSDNNLGTKEMPLKTLWEAVQHANNHTGVGNVNLILAPGIYTIDTTLTLKPRNRSFTKENRLVIKAEFNPNDSIWETGSMPTIIHTMPLSEMWGDRKDPFGGVSYGFMIETSHVTFEGLRILGVPIVEHPRDGYIQRVYPIGRTNPELEDLQIRQCLFIGDDVAVPNHLPILANGNGINVENCIFYKVKQAIVYWSRNSTGHSMKNTLIYGSYGCGIWTSAIANDFEFDNNIIANGNYVWISQTSRDNGQRELPREQQTDPILYQVRNSLFASNKNYTGKGAGPALNFEDIDASILNLVNTTITEQAIELEMRQNEINYLHPKKGTLGAEMKVGLFK